MKIRAKMIRYKYLLPLSLLSSLIQTALYAVVLLIAYLYWTAPNASLVIGTAFPIVLLYFFFIVLIQNLVTLSAKNNIAFLLAILISAVLVLPFVTNFTWFSPVLILFNVSILFMPYQLRKYLISRIRK